MPNVTMYGGPANQNVVAQFTTTTSAADGSVSVDVRDVPELLSAGYQLGQFGGAATTTALLKFLGDRVLSAAGLVRGSTDTQVASIAFTYQIGAATSTLNTLKSKAAVAAGTALGALGTVAADKCAGLLMQINATGTISYKSAALNYAAGYATEAAALVGIQAVAPDASNALMGYVTLKTKTATVWVAGTDAFFGGATGNVASATTFYDAGLGA